MVNDRPDNIVALHFKGGLWLTDCVIKKERFYLVWRATAFLPYHFDKCLYQDSAIGCPLRLGPFLDCFPPPYLEQTFILIPTTSSSGWSEKD